MPADEIKFYVVLSGISREFRFLSFPDCQDSTIQGCFLFYFFQVSCTFITLLLDYEGHYGHCFLLLHFTMKLESSPNSEAYLLADAAVMTREVHGGVGATGASSLPSRGAYRNAHCSDLAIYRGHACHV